MRISVEINGARHECDVEPRTLLSDFIRHGCGLTGTHVGCEHGVCGACTVHLDGEPVRSCLMLAVQADGRSLTTVEGLEWGELHEAFNEHHALQCGFCTAGFLMSATPLLEQDLDEKEVKVALAGNLCRCTGYVGIVEAVEAARRRRREARDA